MAGAVDGSIVSHARWRAQVEAFGADVRALFPDAGARAHAPPACDWTAPRSRILDKKAEVLAPATADGAASPVPLLAAAALVAAGAYAYATLAG